MLTAFLAFAILVMRLFPETPFARSLHRMLVESPLAFSKRIERRHIILIVILLLLGETLILVGSAEIAIAYAIDLSLYADAMIGVTMAASAVRLKSAWPRGRDAVLRLVSRKGRLVRRAARTKPEARPHAASANDDDPAPARLVA
jgi:hypothetical protein